ncbi:MAG: hypothetical protein AUH81_18850 [Candidatus Rokubacteria bacterium 13_1_40CM_4_69_5]|nr:MAG: hypothetical protein AUH81_18850 [Candidatus Rokubacteria bacterium 13_1_40CM_4_69_5]
MSQPRLHRLVLHPVGAEEGTVALYPLPDSLDPLRLARLEVLHRVHDRARQAEEIDLPVSEPALLPQLADQLAPIKLLHGPDDLGGLDPVHVHHLGLHGPLDRRGERLHALGGVGVVGRDVRGDRDRLAEGDEHPPPERLACFEGQADRNEPQLAGMVHLVTQGDAGGAGPDALDAGLGVGGALGIDRDEPALGEGPMTCREDVGVAVGSSARLGRRGRV